MDENKVQVIQKHMDIQDFSEVKNKRQFSRLLDVMSQMGLKPSTDQAIYLQIAKQVSHLTNFAKEMANIEQTDQRMAQLSSETKAIYQQQAAQILKIVEKNELSEPQMIQLLDIVKDINFALKEIDREEKKSLKQSKWIKSSLLNGLIGMIGVVVFALFNRKK